MRITGCIENGIVKFRIYANNQPLGSLTLWELVRFMEELEQKKPTAGTVSFISNK